MSNQPIDPASAEAFEAGQQVYNQLGTGQIAEPEDVPWHLDTALGRTHND